MCEMLHLKEKKKIKSIYEDKDIWRLLHTYQRLLLAASRSHGMSFSKAGQMQVGKGPQWVGKGPQQL